MLLLYQASVSYIAIAYQTMYYKEEQLVDRVIGRMEDLLEDKRALWAYVKVLPDYIDYYLDNPLYQAFNHHVTETISRIKMEEFSVDAGAGNQMGATQDFYNEHLGGYEKNMRKRTSPLGIFWD